MNKTTNINRTLVAAAVAGGAILTAWAWQNISTALQKGIVDGKSIRVSMINSCAVSKETAGTPHFSGCNSIL